MTIPIDRRGTFQTYNLDLTPYIVKKGDCYDCSKCGQTLVRIEPNGILGQGFNELDTAVVLDHHLEKHG